MSLLSQKARYSFANAAASLTAAAALLVGAAPAAATDAFPASCDKFDNTSPVQASPYSEAMQLTIKNLKNYSGWERLRNGVKQSGNDIEGLCPVPLGPGAAMTAFDASVKAIGVNVTYPSPDRRDPNFGKVMPPPMILDMLKGDGFSYTGSIIAQMASMQGDKPNDAFIKGDEGFQNTILLQSVQKAYGLSEHLFMAAEAAAEDDQKININALYSMAPALVQQINDIHAQALVAKAEKRSLNADERRVFQEAILAATLNDPQIRAAATQAAVASMMEKMVDDLGAGKQAVLPPSTTIDATLIKERLSRLPGNMAASETIKNYKAFWDANPDKDMAKQVEPELGKMPQGAKEYFERQKKMEELQKSLPPGMKVIIQ